MTVFSKWTGKKPFPLTDEKAIAFSKTAGKKPLPFGRRKTVIFFNKFLGKKAFLLKEAQTLIYQMNSSIEPYNTRLRKLAFRLIHGTSNPICCVEYGEDNLDLLEIHHADHNGNRWREIHGIRTAFYRYLLFKPEEPKPNLQILCANWHTLVTRNYQ